MEVGVTTKSPQASPRSPQSPLVGFLCCIYLHVAIPSAYCGGSVSSIVGIVGRYISCHWISLLPYVVLLSTILQRQLRKFSMKSVFVDHDAYLGTANAEKGFVGLELIIRYQTLRVQRFKRRKSDSVRLFPPALCAGVKPFLINA
ncbi:hypothetical protein GGS26DRAFT_475962 [Hypomontagnella submonticulosa]|nr:hypothetical protein GGS26DRAFT_475962 [Hypomontagnella submonticulosa]